MELKERFDTNDLDVLTAIEVLLTSAATDAQPDNELIHKVVDFYHDDFDMHQLKTELCFL